MYQVRSPRRQGNVMATSKRRNNRRQLQERPEPPAQPRNNGNRRRRRRANARARRVTIAAPVRKIEATVEADLIKHNMLFNSAQLSNESVHFAEAVTNPFSDGALGASLPDQWAPPTVPANDRLTMIFDPATFIDLDDSKNGDVVVEGFLAAIVPRSLAAGWLAMDFDRSNTIHEVYAITTTYETPAQNPLGDMYCLVTCVIGRSTAHPTTSILAWRPDPQALGIVEGYNVQAFARHEILEATAAGGRIVGAGLKIFANAAPLTTGGTSYGGWITIVDLLSMAEDSNPGRAFETLYEQEFTEAKTGGYRSDPHPHPSLHTQSPILSQRHAAILALNQPGQETKERRALKRALIKARVSLVPIVQAANIEDLLRMRHTYQGVKGVTVRYSPLQSAVQEEYRPAFDDAVFSGVVVNSREQNLASGLGANDLASPTDFVPCVIWKFNTDSGGVPTTYNLRIEATVHLQCIPRSTNPYMTNGVIPDPNYPKLALILENRDVYPVVSRGNSFKSFLSGVSAAMKTLKGAVGTALDIGRLIRDF
jgi:hypothetical protein